MKRIRRGLGLLKKDLYGLRYVVLGIGLYYLTVNFLFGKFCPAAIFLRIPCPGCGMTRALIFVLTGKWAAAWRLQPLVFGWIVLGIWFAVSRYLINRPSRNLHKYLVILLLAMLGLYAWRLIHGFPIELRP